MFGVTDAMLRYGNLRPQSPYGLTLSLAAIPFYLLGQIATHALRLSGDFATKAVVSFTNAPITAGACLVLAAIVQRLGVPRRQAATLALVYGTCTLAWPYAKTFFSEPLTALLLLLAFWALLHVRESSATQTPHTAGEGADHGNLWIAGAMVALGLAVLTRETTVIVLPLFMLYLGARLGTRPDKIRRLVVASLTLTLCLVGVAVWNAARFGSPLATGYSGPLWTLSLLPGLYGLLLSPYKGLLLYVPLVLVGGASWPRFYRAWPREALLCGSVFLVYLLVHSAYLDWPGGGNWGPRFLVPALPFLVCALPFGWTRSWRWTSVTLILCAVSLLVQLPAIYVSYARYYPVIGTRDDMTLAQIADHNPRRSPIVEQWRSIPVVTSHLRHGLPGVSADLSQKMAGQPSSTLPLDQVLRRSSTVNYPDFWFVYLALSGRLSRLIQASLVLLAVSVAGSGLLVLSALRRDDPWDKAI